ncbi:hypothetical protein AB0B15_03045 [Streptomyces sp. NPDC045456]|uniref:hypothetical protein n=1 Tax=Streptomyces sp. NPDC045456 TaxID=3155254 RepID=UPI0033DB7EA2
MNSTATPLDGAIFGSVTALGAIVTALCYYRARRAPTVTNRAITFAFAVCTIGVFFAIPAIAEATEDITGVDNLAKLIAHICAILWSLSLQICMVDIAYSKDYLRRAIYQRIVLAVAVLAVMVPVWLSANRPGVQFITAQADSAQVRVYLLLYLGYTFFTSCELAFMCAKSARGTYPPLSGVVLGFSFSTVAALLGVAYTISRGGYLIAYTMGSAWDLKLEEKVSPALAGLSIIFLFVGLTMPAIRMLKEIRGERRREQEQSS